MNLSLYANYDLNSYTWIVKCTELDVKVIETFELFDFVWHLNGEAGNLVLASSLAHIASLV